MCRYIRFKQRCCKKAACLNPEKIEGVCTRPCGLANGHPSIGFICPKTYSRVLLVDIDCRSCLATWGNYSLDQGYFEPSEQDKDLNPARVYSEITDHDPSEMETYNWYVEYVPLKHEDWFRPVEWDNPASSKTTDVPSSPKSHTCGTKSLYDHALEGGDVSATTEQAKLDAIARVRPNHSFDAIPKSLRVDSPL